MQEKVTNPEAVSARNSKTTMMRSSIGQPERAKRFATILSRGARRFTGIHEVHAPSIPMAEKNDLKSFKCQFESDLGEELALI